MFRLKLLLFKLSKLKTWFWNFKDQIQMKKSKQKLSRNKIYRKRKKLWSVNKKLSKACKKKLKYGNWSGKKIKIKLKGY